MSSQNNSSSVSSDVLFTGQRYSSGSQLYLFRDRFLNSAIGRFLTPDLSRYLDGPNLFAAWFVPHRVDPTGNWTDGPSDGYYFYLERLISERQKKHQQAYNQLLARLKGICASNGNCTCDCSLSQCNIDARQIASSIYQTLENNQTWVSGMFGDGPDRYRGYFCWDWAYGFLDAFALAVGSSSCFTAIIERSVGPTIGKLSSIHYFLRISSICDSSESVFIDDGFANNSFIHDDPPMSGRS